MRQSLYVFLLVFLINTPLVASQSSCRVAFQTWRAEVKNSVSKQLKKYPKLEKSVYFTQKITKYVNRATIAYASFMVVLGLGTGVELAIHMVDTNTSVELQAADMTREEYRLAKIHLDNLFELSNFSSLEARKKLNFIAQQYGDELSHQDRQLLELLVYENNQYQLENENTTP